MAEYWKSTPSYWCKFCHTYVRDTGLERKNHEASGKHQNNIQRSLRELHTTKGREEREKQRAKDEVARLNGLVGGGGGGNAATSGGRPATALVTPVLNGAAQRKAHAEQLAALGVQLPDELKKEVTGVGGWQNVSSRVVEGHMSGERSLADIIKQEGESKENVKDVLDGGLRKRKAGEEEEEAALSKKNKAAWGSRLRTYPGQDEKEEEEIDLDALLSGVTRKRAPDVKEEETADDGSEVKKEELAADSRNSLPTVPDGDIPAASVKQEDDDAVAPVVFKKRKNKR